jgi:MSHA biogenesis protein MshK
MRFNALKIAAICSSLSLALSGGAVADEAQIQDPTRPLNFVAAKTQHQTQEQDLKLQAIILGQGRSEAVINGRHLRLGDTVERAKILSIHPGRVVYERGGVQAELWLRPPLIRPVGGGE